MQDRHFRLIKEAGFNHVRINLHPFKPTHPFASTRRGWKRSMGSSKRWAGCVILDMHEFNAMARDPEGLKPKYLADGSSWPRVQGPGHSSC
jgi:endoglucanase